MSYFGFVILVQINSVELNDFLPKPANKNWMSPMKSRFSDFGETFFFFGETFLAKKGQKREQK
jgi:hypothetical protein